MPDKEIELKRREIIQKLTYARLNKGITQEHLARLIGTKRSNICRIESGVQNVTIDTILKITDALDVDINFDVIRRGKPMNDFYSFRLFDNELMSFSLRKEGLEGLVVDNIKVNRDSEHLLPLDLESTPKGIIKWLERRVVPKNRAFVDEILKTLGLSANDTKGIIDICKGLSLNDSYWVVKSDFNGSFSEYNLFENRFSEILSLVAYTGIAGSEEAFTTSPELTTNGALRKAWRYIENDGIYLYKGGTDGAVNAGFEPYSEYYACQIAEIMGVNCVHYELENWKGILASKCKLFTDVNTSFVPASALIKNVTLKTCLDFYQNLGDVFYSQFCSMLVFDALIYNEDRHFGNFGVLRDNITGEIKCPAPIFDNGISLFNYAMAEDFNDLNSYTSTRSNPYRIPFDEICREVMSRTQKAQLRKLIGFKFERHPTINLPESRLAAIEEFLQVRIRVLLSIPSSTNN